MTKTYLFNPFNIKSATDKELMNAYNEIYQGLIEDPNTMYDYAHNIEVYSNLNYIVGEVIARLTQTLIELKTQIEIKKAVKTVEERNNWKEEDGKKPAISYFEALATRFCEEDIKLLAQKEGSLKRFKNAYTSVEEKLNALKKRMEAVKFEESFN